MFTWTKNTGRRYSNDDVSGSYNNAPTQTTATTIQGSIRPPELSREQHLDSYLKDLTLQRSTRRVSADDSTYDTVFQTVTNVTLILRVHLPPLVHPSAPVRCPTMTLAGVKARHPWLDTRMQVVGYAPMASDEAWRQARLLLGSAVHQVIQHLQVNAPEIIEITDKGLRSSQTHSLNNNGSARTSANNNNNNNYAAAASQSYGNGHRNTFPSHPPQLDRQANATDAPPNYESLLTPPVPDIDVDLPTQFFELDKLTRSELDALLEDELQFLAFANKLHATKELQVKTLSLVQQNVKQAKEHLEKQPMLSSLYQEVVDLRSTLQHRVKEFQELEVQQNKYCEPPDNAQVLRELNKAKRQAFLESEKIAEDWLDEDGELHGSDVDHFCKQFIAQRKIHHVRAAKLELLQS